MATQREWRVYDEEGYQRWLAQFMVAEGITPIGDEKLWMTIRTMKVPPKVRILCGTSLGKSFLQVRRWQRRIRDDRTSARFVMRRRHNDTFSLNVVGVAGSGEGQPRRVLLALREYQTVVHGWRR
ncbi:unnamed protein product [Linum trigynum]|uniref:Uncharacterized protein n=1 Tax=Linum trigynum TaxID=586398 RepID=A0AAV2CEH9_9ROSI